MDTLLILVAVTSLGLAVSLSVIVAKLVREDRRRSDARVAVLVEAAAAPAEPPAIRRTPHVARRAIAPPLPEVGRERTADLPLRTPPRHAPLPDLPELFVEPEPRPAWGRRIALAAGLAAVVLATGFTLMSQSSSPVAPGAPPPPLELLTLRHTAEAGRLTVSGLVQNPRGGAALGSVVAAAVALDAAGNVLAEGRAPLDVTALGPGEESPFAVTFPVVGGVARYRIGFRTTDGRIVAHVDRRAGAEAQARR